MQFEGQKNKQQTITAFNFLWGPPFFSPAIAKKHSLRSLVCGDDFIAIGGTWMSTYTHWSVSQSSVVTKAHHDKNDKPFDWHFRLCLVLVRTKTVTFVDGFWCFLSLTQVEFQLLKWKKSVLGFYWKQISATECVLFFDPHGDLFAKAKPLPRMLGTLRTDIFNGRLFSTFLVNVCVCESWRGKWKNFSLYSILSSWR